MPQVASNAASWSTDVFGSGDAQADARVQAIIAANLQRLRRQLAASASRRANLLANAHLPAWRTSPAPRATCTEATACCACDADFKAHG